MSRKILEHATVHGAGAATEGTGFRRWQLGLELLIPTRLEALRELTTAVRHEGCPGML
jgi:hypothetical protein